MSDDDIARQDREYVTFAFFRWLFLPSRGVIRFPKETNRRNEAIAAVAAGSVYVIIIGAVALYAYYLRHTEPDGGAASTGIATIVVVATAVIAFAGYFPFRYTLRAAVLAVATLIALAVILHFVAP